jgi:predicted phosphodiesterase
MINYRKFKNTWTLVSEIINAMVKGFTLMHFGEKCRILFQLLVTFILLITIQEGFAAHQKLAQSENNVKKNSTIPQNMSDNKNTTNSKSESIPTSSDALINSTKFPISVNKTEVLRIGVSGDMDCNSEQKKQFDLLNKYNVDVFLSGGDYGYDDGECVLKELTKRGFTNSNSLIAVGNHDSCSELRKWLENNECYGKESFGDGRLDVWTIDSNKQFGNSSSQFSNLSKSMMSSKAQHKIVLIHEPFVTADSKYETNGEFNIYHQLFKDAGIDIVIQAHNHNYQRFMIDNVAYYVVGTGTHDEGSKLYDLESNDYDGYPLLKGIDNENGIAIFDLSTEIKQWFLSNTESVLDMSIT